MVKAFADLADLPEEDRIRIIAAMALEGQRVGFVVEDDAKADRYIKELTSNYEVEVASRGPGPVPNTILVAVIKKTPKTRERLSGYGSRCPTCGDLASSVCRCLLGDTRCMKGHHWHECKVHGLVPYGAKHGSASSDGCTCQKEKETSH